VLFNVEKLLLDFANCYHCVKVYCAFNLDSLCHCMNSVVATIENCIYSRLSELNCETGL